jgi:hypothetical protein
MALSFIGFLYKFSFLTCMAKIIKSWTIVGFVLALVLIVGCTSANNTQTNTPTGNMLTGNSPAADPPQNNAKAKLSDTRFANSAYLISGDTLDASAKSALAGFTMQKTANPDGSVSISLSSTNQNYQNQTYTLQPGQQLYFIERTMGDDGADTDFNLGDDTAVVVDANGYIVQ